MEKHFCLNENSVSVFMRIECDPFLLTNEKRHYMTAINLGSGTINFFSKDDHDVIPVKCELTAEL